MNSRAFPEQQRRLRLETLMGESCCALVTQLEDDGPLIIVTPLMVVKNEGEILAGDRRRAGLAGGHGQ